MRIFRASEIAEKLRLSRQTLVRYEKKGIFPKPRRNRINQWREYSEDDLRKMEQILGRGMSLVELIMVMAIIGIMVGLAIPRIDSFYSMKLAGAAQKTVSDIRYVQQLAVSRHESYKITFYNNPVNRYDVQKLDNSFALSPFGRNNFRVDFINDPQYKGIRIASVSFGSSNVLRFDWQGAPQDAAGNPLAADGQVRFSCRNEDLSIYVSPNTGWVRVQ
jgi:prepilin-type N-terminal cleavage/methylation domain-containing protein